MLPWLIGVGIALASGGSSDGWQELAAHPVAADPQAQTLTLPDALRLARAHHPTTRIAEARVAQARAGRRVVTADLLPSLSGQGSYTRRPRDTRVDGADAVIQAQHAFRATATLFVPVVDLQGIQSLAASGTGVAATEHEVDSLRRELGFLIADAYLAVLAAEQVLEAARRRATVANQVVEAARLRLNAGVATRNDLTRTELEQATAELEVVMAAGQVDAAREVLAALIGVESVGPLADPELDPPQRAAPRPDLQALELRAEQRRQEARAWSLGIVPRLGLFAGATATNEAGFLRRNFDWNVGAQATWSAFDGGRRLAAADRSRASASEFEALADDLRLSVRRDLETARVQLRTADAAFEIAHVQARVADRNAEEVRQRFSQGLATALEVSDAAASAFQAEAGLARQRYERKRSALGVAEAMGAWMEELVR